MNRIFLSFSLFFVFSTVYGASTFGSMAIALDPSNSDNVYMLVGTSYFNSGTTAILRSFDRGNTFAITNVTSQFTAHGNGMGRQTGEKLVIDPNKGTILFCGTRSKGKVVRIGDFMYYSNDTAKTWIKAASLKGKQGSVSISADGGIVLHSPEDSSFLDQKWILF